MRHASALVFLLLVHCSTDSFVSGSDAGTDADVSTGPDVATLDAVSPEGGQADAALACPIGKGPLMVRVTTSDQSFCIDQTEVTINDYDLFLAAKAGDTSGQPPFCQWNIAYAPTSSTCNLTADTNLPMSCLDWCDAYAYCAWAGKRLCGDEKGAMLDPAELGTKHEEWYVACSHNDDGLHAYPYANAFDAAKCNSAGSGGSGLVAVKSKVDCVGGYGGLYDMSGNIDEWDMTCADWNNPVTDGGAALVGCFRRGGSWYPPSDHAYYGTCGNAAVTKFPRQDQGGGVRCCAD